MFKSELWIVNDNCFRISKYDWDYVTLLKLWETKHINIYIYINIVFQLCIRVKRYRVHDFRARGSFYEWAGIFKWSALCSRNIETIRCSYVLNKTTVKVIRLIMLEFSLAIWLKINYMGVLLSEPIFSHDQGYVALLYSRNRHHQRTHLIITIVKVVC